MSFSPVRGGQLGGLGRIGPAASRLDKHIAAALNGGGAEVGVCSTTTVSPPMATEMPKFSFSAPSEAVSLACWINGSIASGYFAPASSTRTNRIISAAFCLFWRLTGAFSSQACSCRPAASYALKPRYSKRRHTTLPPKRQAGSTLIPTSAFSSPLNASASVSG